MAVDIRLSGAHRKARPSGSPSIDVRLGRWRPRIAGPISGWASGFDPASAEGHALDRPAGLESVPDRFLASFA